MVILFVGPELSVPQDPTMLAPNTILNQGRYRVASNFWSNASHSLYEAHDNIFGQHVVICEGPDPRASGVKVFDRDADNRQFSARFNRLKSFSHEALIGVRDNFYHADRKYLVSDAVDGTSISQLAALRSAPVTLRSVVVGLERIIDAYSRFANASGNIRYFGTDPGSIRITREGELRFLYFGSEDESEFGLGELENTPRSALSFMPLETLWPRLDIASQKVISNNYNERSLEVLESPPDFRSDIFVLGSAGYFLLTGRVPVGALERSIEVLDGYADPLVPVHEVEPSVPIEISEFIAKSMNIYRQDRFDSFATISRQLAVFVSDFSEQPQPKSELMPQTSGHPQPQVAEIKLDDMDLLEIPEVPVSTPATFVYSNKAGNGVTTSATVSVPMDLETPRPTPTPAVDRFEMPIRSPKVEFDDRIDTPDDAPRSVPNDRNEMTFNSPTGEFSDQVDMPLVPPAAMLNNRFETPETAGPEVSAIAAVDDHLPTVDVTAKPLFETNPTPDHSFDLEADLFDDVKPRSNAWAKPALIAAAVVLVLGVGSWLLYSYSRSDDQSSMNPPASVDTKAVISAEPAPTQEVLPQADTTSLPSEVPNNETKAEPVRSETVREPSTEVPAQVTRPRQNVPETKPKVDPKPATAQVPAKQKKKITVEDLINEN